MRNIIKNLGSIMLLICLSLILLTGCSRKSQLKLAIEMANKQCPMSIGTTGEISSITFDGTDVIYSLLMNEDYLDLDALGKNTDAMKSAVMVMFKNPKGEIKSMLEMVVDTKSGIRLIYKGKSTGKEVECRLDTEELKRILNQKGTEKESERQKLEELVPDHCTVERMQATTTIIRIYWLLKIYAAGSTIGRNVRGQVHVSVQVE